MLGLTLLAAPYAPKIPPGVKVGGVSVGSMSKGQAAYRLRQWWEQERQSPITLALKGTDETFTATASQMGIALDDAKSAEQVDADSFFESLKRSISGEREDKSYELAFKKGTPNVADLASFVEKRVPERSPARVIYEAGSFKRTPEQSGFKLDAGKVYEAALLAMKESEIGEIPLVVAPKTVADDAREEIDEIRSEFTTRFSEGKASRSNNIRVAARKIDGLVLAPGEQFSFNRTVGRRTAEAGFMEAGVYKDGKHDVDIGGGICQVSTTLYKIGRAPV